MSKIAWESLLILFKVADPGTYTYPLVMLVMFVDCPQYFDGYFTFNSKIHSRATRQRDLLHLPAVRTEVAKRSFYYYGCVVFNDISLCLKN